MVIQEDSNSGGSQSAMASGAISAVSDAAIKRGEEFEHTALIKTGKKVAWVIFAVVVICLLGYMIWDRENTKRELLDTINQLPRKPDPLPALADVPVAILLPETAEGRPAWDNAVRQKEGFRDALEDAPNLSIEFDFGALSYDEKDLSCQNEEQETKIECEASKKEARDKEIERLLKEIKKRYYADEDPIRVFLITMSGAAYAIKDEFEDWVTNKDANDDEVDPRDRPVLIATVASAPDIANREKGVLRHYIRSKDEAAVLSTYLESTRPAPEAVGIFRVNDEYGQQATRLLINRLEEGLGITKEKRKWFKYGPNPEMKEVENDVQRFIEEIPGKPKVAVIVGYGKMISSTLEALRVKTDFEGPILVVSTFTEKRWRPCFLISESDKKKPDLCPSGSDDGYDPEDVFDEEFAKRIHTVGPDKKETDADYRGVVYQFSYMTLDRVLQSFKTKTTEKDCSTLTGEGGVRAEGFSELFWDCWIDEETSIKLKKKWADVELTADGDSHVTLKLLDYRDWT